MKRIARIKRIGQERTGVTKQTNEPWTMTDIIIEWDEQEPNCKPYSQSLVVTVSKKLNRPALEFASSEGHAIEVTFYCNTREHEGRAFNSIKAYLPNEFYEGGK